MRDIELKKKVKSMTKAGRILVEKNLFIRVSAELKATWAFRASVNGKAKELRIGDYGLMYGSMTKHEAQLKKAELVWQIKQGRDPFAEARNGSSQKIKTFDDLANNWIVQECSRLKNPQIPTRIYNKEIKPYIGSKQVDRVSGIDIQEILNRVIQSKRKAVANDTLLHLKQIFKHGVRIGVSNSNPASAFTNKQAGGTETPRNRFLSMNEIAIVFETLRQHQEHFVIENYIAMGILLLLGMRKTEVTQAKWTEIDIEKQEWLLESDGTKTNASLVIPIPDQLVSWLKFLKVIGGNSDYLFPSRRASKKPYISDDTLNHALSKLFGRKTGKLNSSNGNMLGPKGVDYFVVHDLRRTCRTHLASLEVDENVAEKCLNHKITGVKGVYNQYSYFKERKVALQKLADHVFPLISNTVIPEL